MRTAVLADDFLHLAAPGRKYGKVAAPGQINYASLCDLAIQHQAQCIWLCPGSAMSTKLIKEPGALHEGVDSLAYAVRERVETSGVPKFTSVQRQEGSYQERRPVFIGLPEHDSNWSDSSGWALADVESPVDLLGSIAYVQEAINTPILFSPGYSGIELLRDMHKHHSWLAPCDISALPRYTEKDILFARSLLPEEREMGYVHIFDRNGQYLAGGTGAECGEGDPIRVAGPRYDKSICGIWYVEASDPPYGFPQPLEGDYATSAMIEAMVFLGMRVTIHGGWMWKNHHRTMNTWCKKWWDLRLDLRTNTEKYPNRQAASAAEKMSKIIPNRAISWLDLTGDRGNTKNPLHRPDIRNQLVGMSRARMLITAMRIYNLYQMRPVTIRTDEIAWTSNEPDIERAFPEMLRRRDELGGFKPVGTLPITDELIGLLASTESEFTKINIMHALLERVMQHG